MSVIPASVRTEAHRASIIESEARVEELLQTSRDCIVNSMMLVADAAGIPEEKQDELKASFEVNAQTVTDGIFRAVHVASRKRDNAKKAGDRAVLQAEDEMRSQAVRRSFDRMLGATRG